MNGWTKLCYNVKVLRKFRGGRRAGREAIQRMGARARGRGKQERFGPTAERVLRMKQALDLRLAGLSYRAIAAELHVTTTVAYADVQDALELTLQEPADQIRKLELERLDEAYHGLLPGVRRGDTFSVDAMVKVMNRRAKLLGIDAPAKIAPTDPSGERPYAGTSDAELVSLLKKLTDPEVED